MTAFKDRVFRRLLTAGGWIGLLLLAGAACIRALSFPLNGDVGWWLHISRRMLAGDVLYRDLVEVNPPMTAYVMMIPVWVSDISGLPISAASTLCTLALMLGMAAWVMGLTRRPGGSGLDIPVAGAAVVVAAGLLPGTDFAQREHLMFMLLLPYTFVLWRRAVGLSVSFPSGLTAGFAAGVGLALKPHFLLIPVVLEVVSYLETGHDGPGHLKRLRTVERLTVLAVLTTYGASVLFRGVYLPLLVMTADAYSRFAAMDRLQIAVSGTLFGLLACLPLVIRPRSEIARLARFFVAIGFAAQVLVILQGKGWSYHFYPSLAALAAAAILLAYDFVARAWNVPARVHILDGISLVLVLSITLLQGGLWIEMHDRVSTERKRMLAEQVAYLAEIQTHGSLLVLSAVVGGSYPLVNYSGLEPASPFPSMWWVRARPEDRRRGTAGKDIADLVFVSPTERKLTRMLVAKFRRSTPGTVLVDTTSHRDFAGARFPLVEYLEQDEEFRQEWRNYAREGGVGPFVVWVRRSAEDPASRTRE